MKVKILYRYIRIVISELLAHNYYSTYIFPFILGSHVLMLGILNDSNLILSV